MLHIEILYFFDCKFRLKYNDNFKGGITNFDLQPKLARVFRKGLLKAARTTDAWIFTSGIDAGVVRQVAAALESAIPSKAGHSKIVSVGIAPWGILKRREDLIGLVSK